MNPMRTKVRQIYQSCLTSNLIFMNCRKMTEDALFNLRWDAQRSALLGSMASLYREEAFVDTTIVADNKIFKAHKLLLSASSSYLKNMLEVRNQTHLFCTHQIIRRNCDLCTFWGFRACLHYSMRLYLCKYYYLLLLFKHFISNN